jgi:hypothetical protein
MLFIVVAEQAIQNGGVAIDENARDPRKNQGLVVFSRICGEMPQSPVEETK